MDAEQHALRELSDWSQQMVEGLYSNFVIMKSGELSEVYHLPIEDRERGVNTLCMQNRMVEKDLRRYHVSRVNLRKRRVCSRCLEKKRKMVWGVQKSRIESLIVNAVESVGGVE